VVEPGVTPATDITLGPWQTFTEFEEACGQSRLHAGVHFQHAITSGRELCQPIGDRAFEKLNRLLAGDAR
jgi:hypothetical protein